MGLLSEFPSPRWSVDQGQGDQLALSSPGYAASGTRSHPLLFVGIQGVPCGSRSRARGLRHLLDVLMQYGAHPYKHPVTMLTPLIEFNSKLIKHLDPRINELWLLSDFNIMCVVLKNDKSYCFCYLMDSDIKK